MIEIKNLLTGDFSIIFADLYNLLIKDNNKKKIIINKIEDFIEYILKKNHTIIIPTYNFFFPRLKKTGYSSSYITAGFLSKHLIKKFNFSRTDKPMYNFGVLGSQAKKILSLKQTTAWGEDSVIGFLSRNNSNGIGINIDSNNYGWLTIHCCEENLQVPYRFYKTFYSLNVDTKKRVFEKMYVRDLKINAKIDVTLISRKLLKKKKIKNKKINGLSYTFINLTDYYNEGTRLLKKNINGLIEYEK